MNFVNIKNTYINLDNVLYYETSDISKPNGGIWYKIRVYLQTKEYPLEFNFEGKQVRDSYLSDLNRITMYHKS